MSRSVKLFETAGSDSSGSEGPKPSATLSGESFNFALPLPTYTANGRDPLPPSQSLSQQGTHCNVNYTVRIDIVRKGLRRHERWVLLSVSASLGTNLCVCQSTIRATIPIMYLPRSTPPGQVQSGLIHDPLSDYGDEEGRFVTVDIHSSNSARGALEKLQTSAQVLVAVPCLCQTSLCRLMRYIWKLTLPSPKIYTSGDSIPLTLTLVCSKLPSLPQLLAKSNSLDICLVRRSRITPTSGVTQEAIVSKAELQYTDNSTEGVSRSHWVLQLGKSQRHISWRVDGLVEVKVQ